MAGFFVAVPSELPLLEALNLACERGGRPLFSGLAFSAVPGTLLRVAGPNGTGKTSLLRILTGLAKPVAGEVRWRGAPITSLREEFWKDLAYLGHLNAVKDDLTCIENLQTACQLVGVTVSKPQAVAALDALGLAGREDSPARFLSQGQRRRIALARLELLPAVPLWILDEPFTALDTQGVDTVRDLIAGHIAGGGIVVFTTHQEVDIPAPQVITVDLRAPAEEAC